MTVPRWAWLVWIAAFGLLELAAITNDVPGDTLSGLIQTMVRAYPLTSVVVGAGLVWLTYHLLLDKRQRR